MTLPNALKGRLRLPVIAAPMFLVSGTELVIAQCKAGILGSFPSLNARPEAELPAWLAFIQAELAAHDAAHPEAPSAPFGVNLVANKTNTRFEHDAACCVAAEVPLILTSLSPPGDLVRAVHGYGGLVFHDVTTVRHAEKALEQGVDGLVLVAAGAGGHAGAASPFALIQEIRAFYDGTLVLAGAIAAGAALHGALNLGADLVYMGSRFIAAKESNAPEDYRAMVVNAALKDVVYTPYFSGLPANYLAESITAAGISLDEVRQAGADPTRYRSRVGEKPKAWRDVRGAGQGVGAVRAVQSVAEIVDELEQGWRAAEAGAQARAATRAAWLRGGGGV
ncbi:MAG: nitronate monooxygenase family protein [Roseicyclus sp.]|jgi:nitronate monooxygenase